ncbi:hypothetical protein CONPUDRAFT_124551 [Coniophora puteana RWD-64-598 SS2]|uniref:DUF4419 domain-containing protein n=1 Tax=Coniophora puteana (strain RWD-64-598) TaxID=741705 RepID=A0A5M3MQF0_CONPW|nr:uncharacterized protein CONPUDRAFT_124551 [Coniophora puteana RWD-64-598 SS2]EIW81428.1 hypothetical protein CONPUDRAFT_124551 [Coniophora puteana RWD-64-598 SS2]
METFTNNTLTSQSISTAPTSVVFKPATHPAESFERGSPSGHRKSADKRTAPEKLLQGACNQQYKKCAELLQSSIPKEVDISDIIPQRNGLVHTLLEAYNNHRALVLRPDDVWLAIVTQFSFFVNAHAEELRSLFVAHEGKMELKVTAIGTRYTVDFGSMARQMADLLEINLTDAELRKWATPTFSTTTITDSTIYAIALMATTKKYFDFTFALRCGIPRVTLDGAREDWVVILQRIEKLKEYGFETTAWCHLLRPVLSRFVNAFDDPTGKENIDFWGKIAHIHSGGSGPSYLMGWVTAFCVFDADGKWKGPHLLNLPPSGSPSTEYAKLSGETFAKDHFAPQRGPRGAPYLTLDGVSYPRVETGEIPVGTAEVDVKLDDNGEIFKTLLVAGSMGSAICSSNDKYLSQSGQRDTVRPVPGWWMFIKKEGEGSEE